MVYCNLTNFPPKKISEIKQNFIQKIQNTQRFVFVSFLGVKLLTIFIKNLTIFLFKL